MEIPDIYPFGTDEELDSFLETWGEYDSFPELKWLSAICYNSSDNNIVT